MIHATPHPLAGKTVTLKLAAEARNLAGGATMRVEDYYDRVAGRSWTMANGNPAALHYAMRSGFSGGAIPLDDEVVYGKVGGFSHLVHVSELGDEVAAC